MVGQEEWMDVLSLRKEGHTISAIRRLTGMSRNTIRRFCSRPVRGDTSKRQGQRSSLPSRNMSEGAGRRRPCPESGSSGCERSCKTEDQKRAVYETVPQTYAGKTEAEAFKLIEANLRTVRLTEARRKLLADLRKKYAVQVLIEAPKLVAAIGGDDPSTGPANAPVTLVEYSDFQCPYCARAYPTVKQLLAKYKTSGSITTDCSRIRRRYKYRI